MIREDFNLDNLYIFDNKKASKYSKEAGLSFSIAKTKRNALLLRFYFNERALKKYNLSTETKIKFGCAKDNHLQWYILIGKDGYNLYKVNKNYPALYSVVNCPFKFDSAFPSRFISGTKIEQISENIIGFSVHDIFEELYLGERK